ncbi:hypothetical protein CRM93_02955 [Acetobacter fabarum]|uniref:Uncharacterized protein n=1 Tax=Acetobacter fabarum TaxID=483199 RepID=A0A269Y1H0_9PROT|nr:hypothetical protein B8X00_03535 [Acetobacter fabarum]PEN28019.1 hypothetical protein CRM93_02955 [Acetobacter fabarum]
MDGEKYFFTPQSIHVVQGFCVVFISFFFCCIRRCINFIFYKTGCISFHIPAMTCLLAPHRNAQKRRTRVGMNRPAKKAREKSPAPFKAEPI